MTDIICHDGQGYPLEFLSQWDTNQVAVIRGIELSPVPCVRFSNKSSIVSLVVKPTVVGDSFHPLSFVFTTSMMIVRARLDTFSIFLLFRIRCQRIIYQHKMLNM